MKKYYLSTLVILFSFLSLPVYAEVVANSGFIPGQIWYSENKLIEGDTVNVHTAIWNGHKDSYSIKVEFYDKKVVLGDRTVILDSLELKDVYIPWKVTSGDHIISAKIISSELISSGKKEKVVMDRIETSNDKQFVSTVVKNAEGELVSSGDIIKDKINETSSVIGDVVPEKISDSVANGFTTLNDFREKTFTKVDTAKKETKKELGSVLGASTEVSKDNNKTDNTKDIQDVVKKPITYIKLFLLSTLAFILGNKIVFYCVLVIIAFYILRFIYRKIRNK